jgi:hypothetical protein
MSIVFASIMATAMLFGHHVPSSGYDGAPGQTQVCEYTDNAGNGILYTATYC